jgi:type IV secretion system protein VirD4
MAPTRSGKDVGTVLPNLLLADRAILCVDPKGENARISARARRRFGPVFVLDPFGVSGQPSSAFDPAALLDPASPDLADDATTLADALVFDPPGQVSDAHWNEEAKALIGGLLLHLACRGTPGQRGLPALRQLLTLPPDDWQALLRAMLADTTAAGGLVSRAAARQLGKADREAAGVLSSAQRHTPCSTARASPPPWPAPTFSGVTCVRAAPRCFWCCHPTGSPPTAAGCTC